MIHAYNKIYLDDACNLLGSFFDIAVNEFKHSFSDAFDKFHKSEECKLFEIGSPFVISGMSGNDLFNRIFNKEEKSNRVFIVKTREYWVGYSLAYYQWYTSVSFDEIYRYVKTQDLLDMYDIYHEMDIMHFIDKLNSDINQTKEKTNLEIRRTLLRLSRKQLATYSGVPIRTIEQYEQGLKDINKARAITLYSLSKVLFCKIEHLLELTKQ